MFNSLVRSLPSLSGNISLSCILEKSFITKVNNNEYIASVKNAELIPLQNVLYNKRLPISLLTDNWEYNVSTFFHTYSSIFYNNEYSLNVKYDNSDNIESEDYKIIDITGYDQISDRNKDYEFGCKRVRYLINGTQFSFYAPIYIDNVNSLPDYFVIKINFNKRYNKIIKIQLAKNSTYNYLGTYLKRYLDKIDDNVIFCMPYSNQATYYGISCEHGGFEQVKDNDFGQLYNTHKTINNFDYIICNGFKRNKLMMKQIIPLAFRFNLNDILSDIEKQYFEFYKITISGYYENDYIKYDLYDFDIDYEKNYPIHRIYDEESGNFIYNTDINVMDIDYPSLKEMRLYEYKYSNKVSPHYCRWKLKHSTNDTPYIVNLSYGYSYLNYPELKYGDFPTMFKDIRPQAVILNNDFKLPYGDYKDKYYICEKYENNIIYKNSININKYNKLVRNSYSSWFNIYDENLLFEISNWADVKDNEAYFKGVFYNLSEITKLFNISKFAVFVNPITRYANNIDEDTANDLHVKKSKITIFNKEDDETIDVCGINYNNESRSDMFSFNHVVSSYIKENIYLKVDPKGNFIKYDEYEQNNTYYKISDLIQHGFAKKINIDGTTYDAYNINGYELINIHNNINMFEDYYDAEEDTIKERIIYREIFTEDTTNKYNGIKERLYISNTNSSNKVKLKNTYDNFTSNEDVYGKYALYIEDKFIFVENIDKVFDIANGNLSQCKEYEFIPYNNNNGIVMTSYFTEKNKIYPPCEINSSDVNRYLNNFIFVDLYNLTSYINVLYPEGNNDLITYINSLKKYTFYCKLIDKNHVKELYRKLQLSNSQKETEILKLLYNRKRVFSIDLANENIEGSYDKISINDSYLRLDNLLEFYTDNIPENKIPAAQIDRFFNSLSDNRTVNDKFKLIIENSKEIDSDATGEILEKVNIYLDLCYKKEVVLLDKQILSQIMQFDKGIDNYNFLYLYKLEDTADENYDILYKYGYSNKYSNFYKKFEIKDVYNYIVPLFENIYINDNDRKLEYNIIQNDLNKIKINDIKINNECNYYYSYNNLNDCFIELNDDIINELNINAKRYSVYNVLDTSINENLNLAKIEKLFIFDTDENGKELLIENNKNLFWLSLVKFAKKYNVDIDNIEQYINDNLHDYIEYIGTDYVETFANNISINNVSYTFVDFYDRFSLAEKCLIYRDETTELNVYKYNDKYYAAYVINVNIDNTNMSFYTTDDDKLNFNFFTSINNKSITSNESFKTVLKEVFWRVYPFVKTNLFTYLVRLHDNVVVLPTEFNLKVKNYPIKYNESEYIKSCNKNLNELIRNEKLNKIVDSKTYIKALDDNELQSIKKIYDNEQNANRILISNSATIEEKNISNDIDLEKKYHTIVAENENNNIITDIIEESQEKPEYYTLYALDEKDKINIKNIKLIRYFNRIVPYIKKVYKVSNFTLNKLKYDEKKYIDNNIIYNEDLYFNNYNPIKIYTDVNKYDKCYQFEHKHFNDNLFYNFVENFILYTKRLFTDREIKKYRELELEYSEDIYSPYFLFDKYVKETVYNITNKNSFGEISKNEMLFLFNNYKINYIVKFDSLKNGINYYTLNYEFMLK